MMLIVIGWCWLDVKSPSPITRRSQVQVLVAPLSLLVIYAPLISNLSEKGLDFFQTLQRKSSHIFC